MKNLTKKLRTERTAYHRGYWTTFAIFTIISVTVFTFVNMPFVLKVFLIAIGLVAVMVAYVSRFYRPWSWSDEDRKKEGIL